MSKVLGIDLGTTNSCMAMMEGKTPVVINNAEGSPTTPSVVAFTKKGECLVGQAAKRQAVTNPSNTIFSAKRLIGRKFSEIQEEAQSLPYKLVEGRNGDAWIQCQCGDKEEKFAPEQISAKILAKLKADAEAFLGEKIEKAVITVPAYFNDAQRQATKDAGTIAGFDVLRIINEPTAASLAYGLDRKKDETIAVYDLGGGTYDVSILEIGDGVFEVKATNGDTHLGGDNWDSLIIKWLVEEFKKKNGIDLGKDPMALQRLKEEAEKAKITLSSAQNTDIKLPFITANQDGPIHLDESLSRAKFEQICEDLFERTVTPFKACLKDAKLDPENPKIEELVLVGGMTRMPKVIKVAEKLAGKSPCQGVNPDEVVAHGAAIQGAVLQGDVSDVLLLDVTPLTLGIETAGNIATPMIKRNTTIPTKQTQEFSTYADQQTAVDIKVLQGERPMADDNKILGNFKLDGIPPAPRGTPKIEVTFDIDANGILHVTAKDLGTGKDQKITITGSSGLSEKEVEDLKKEAEVHAEEDRKKRETAQTYNELETMIYTAEKQIKDLGDKIPADKKEALEEKIKSGKEALASKDTEVVKSAKESLETFMQEIAQEIYSKVGPEAGTQTPEGDKTSKNEKESDNQGSFSSKSKGGDDETVEAEIVDEEDK